MSFPICWKELNKLCFPVVILSIGPEGFTSRKKWQLELEGAKEVSLLSSEYGLFIFLLCTYWVMLDYIQIVV